MTRYLVTCLLLGALLWVFWPAGERAQDENPLHTQLVDRAWIDHMPVYPDDKIDLLFLDSDSRIGVFQNMSVYEGDFSLFAWRNRSGDRFDLTMLQHRKDHRLRYKVTDRGCGEFDLCMVVEGAPRGARKYFSMEEWGNLADRETAARELRALMESRALQSDN